MGDTSNYGRRKKTELIADGVGQRRYGEGSLFQTTVHNKTVWRAAKVVQDETGKRRKVVGTGETASIALERLAINLEGYKQTNGEGVGKAVRKPRKTKAEIDTPTFTEVATEWLEWRKHYSLPNQHKQPLGIQVANQYRLIIKNHLSEWGKRPITEYDTDTIRDFTYYKLQERNLSNSHLRSIQGVIYQVFAFAVERHYLKSDPARDLLMSPRNKNSRFAKVKGENLEALAFVPDRLMSYLVQGKTQADFLTDGKPDVARYNAYQRLSPYEARWAMSVLLALRPAEVLGLTWDRLKYLENRTAKAEGKTPYVVITQQLARNPEQVGKGTKLYIKENAKTKAGERALPLSKELVEIILNWKKTQQKWKKSPDWQPYDHLKDLVFTTKTGKPIRQQDDNAAWKELLANAFTVQDDTSDKIRALRLYSLRHLAITRMLRNGVQLAIVSEIAGHTSVSLTHDVYGHLDMTDRVKPLNDLSDKTLKERMKKQEKMGHTVSQQS